ncbi:hypothetical protein [Yinghuangia sp. YIM S09857]|uniref:hypothetical protein n=1 Tax=Yinghuangia sp. YIM S09857 TaxID=3436929 RepID=UPI003F53826E
MTYPTTARRGPDAPTVADSIAEATRTLSYVLQSEASRGVWPPTPADAYRIVGALVIMAGRLPDVLHEMTGIAHEPDGLRIDDGSDPRAHLRRLCVAIGEAQQHVSGLESALNTAWTLLGAVGYDQAQDAQ